jgi:hypothetical protein
MQNNQNKKKKITKEYIKKINSKKQPHGYQPNNPLTIYFKKYIEKQKI